MASEKRFFLKRRKSVNDANAAFDIEETNVITKSARSDLLTDEIALPRTIKSSFFLRQQQVSNLTEASIGNKTSSYDNDGINNLRHQHLFENEVNTMGNNEATFDKDGNENKNKLEEDEEKNNEKDMKIHFVEDLSIKQFVVIDKESNDGKQNQETISRSQQLQRLDMNVDEVVGDFKDFDLSNFRDTVLARVNDFSVKFKTKKFQFETQYKSVQDLNGRLVEVCRDLITEDPFESILSKVVARKDQLNRIRDTLAHHGQLN